jgi:hypothetical protein
MGHGGNEVRQTAIADLDVDEFIAVQNDHPVGVENREILLRRAQGLWLRLFVGGGGVVAAQDGRADLAQTVEHRVGPVAAVVGVDNDPVDADDVLKRDPLQQGGRLVAHHRNGCDPVGHCARP